MPDRVVPNAVCTFCGCVCDDIELTVEGDRITRAKNACVLGVAWFQNHPAGRHAPDARIGGEPASLDAAVEEAARILAGARYPLIFGLSNTTSEAQREAVRLADVTGACIDTTTSVCHGPTELALQAVGKPAATLGEVRNRADLIVYWGCNPAEGHPRHFTRYTLTPRGRFVPEGRKGRYMVLVDVRRTASARAADEFIQIRPGKDFELIAVLRALVRGRPVDVARAEATGVPLERARSLAERMKKARFGVIFFGMGISMTRGKQLNSAALLTLAADLNQYTRFLAMPLRGHGNVTGADTVLTWQTGYPFAVNFSRGYPRFGPGEFTAVDVLVRREADAALILASDPAANFPAPAREHLARIPTIVLDPKVNETSRIARVHITTAPYGISVGGTVYRMDEIPLPLRPALPSPYPPDEEVVRRIADRVLELTGRTGSTEAGGAVASRAAEAG
ncbi:formylmethanofuran dehydrogenase subunit B [Caldinitratiruptor microaerophilus]|uniref:Formylmethanofuran dehydrogenase subunit B n=1 Tax=Caldinitratiruptor microaerophilus TaxID=671077 RepID=A0AA35CJP5_9FIRM|nr:formylmethanofuran dehydrogenase subunit B [Caldinitratiruptor microaerophilus]BDG60452.1 formylmethanofuran dehydrogenase subunit B [Caldinitratiruptor microaerophilus]